MSPVESADGGCAISIRVTPRSSTFRVKGVRRGNLELAVTAPPVDGKANDAIIDHVAELFGVRKSGVEITKGRRSRRKTVRLFGVSETQATRRIEELMS